MTHSAWSSYRDLFCCALIFLFSCPFSPFLCSVCPACAAVADIGSCGGREWVLVLIKKVWLHRLAQQVPALCLGQVSPFELQKCRKLGIAIIKRYYSMLYIITTHSRLFPAWNLPGIPGNKGERDLNTNDSWRRGHLIVFWLIARLPAREKFAYAELGIFFTCRKMGWVLVGLYIFLMLPRVNYVKVHVATRSVFPS